MASDYSVAWKQLLVEVKILRTVNYQLIELFERSFIQEEFKTFARSHLSGLVLLLDSRRTATLFCQ